MLPVAAARGDGYLCGAELLKDVGAVRGMGYHTATDAGRSFTLVGSHGGVRRVIELAGLLPLLAADQPPTT